MQWPNERPAYLQNCSLCMSLKWYVKNGPKREQSSVETIIVLSMPSLQSSQALVTNYMFNLLTYVAKLAERPVSTNKTDV